MSRSVEILLHRFQREIINKAKNFKVLLKLYEVCVCFILCGSVFMGFPIFLGKYIVLHFSFLENGGF